MNETLSLPDLIDDWLVFYRVCSPASNIRNNPDVQRVTVAQHVADCYPSVMAVAVGLVWNHHRPDTPCRVVDNVNYSYLELSGKYYDAVHSSGGRHADMPGFTAPNRRIGTVTPKEMLSLYDSVGWAGYILIERFCVRHEVPVPGYITDAIAAKAHTGMGAAYWKAWIEEIATRKTPECQSLAPQ